MRKSRGDAHARVGPFTGGAPFRSLPGTLLALCLLLMAACGRQSSTDSASHTAPATATFVPAAVVGAVSALHMFDARTGWAATAQQLLRTTDGGLHWSDVTPPTPPGPSLPPVDLFPSSAAEAWSVRSLVAGGPGASQSAVSHTRDGGRTWHTITLPVFAVAQITFADAEHGWMLADLDTADGEQGVDIFRTTDGGTTWAQVARAADRTGALPVQGRKTGLTFHDATTGWATGAGAVGVAASGTPWCFRTQDGGATWHLVPLPLPASLAQYPWFYVTGVLPPAFFSSQLGALPVVVGSRAAGGEVLSVVYVTRDGGATWSPTAPVETIPRTASWLDMSHWWIAADADAGGGLFGTADGGAHWAALTPGAPFAHVSVLSFVSNTLGWAIGRAGLLRTTDGGRTWAVLAAAPSTA
jgi:photosystem II stability/assembly factor-like uncharacterized protein